MTSERLQAEFVGNSGGRIFLLLRRPEKATDRFVLFVPPFGEEMNKCRRQFTETAKVLAARGMAALLVDLYGTGDSEGDFAAATWGVWKANVLTAVDWAAQQGLALGGLLAARIGCTLAAESFRDANLSVPVSVFWQPVEKGSQFLAQFLRLRVAASMMEPDRKETADELRARLADGETLEVAGYALTHALGQALERADLVRSLGAELGVLRVVEVGRLLRDDGLSAVGKRLLAAADDRGIESTGCRISGEPFWTATEIVTNDRLAEVTAGYLALAS